MLSTNIRKLRKEAKLSQEQMAEKLCVSRQAVTKWETDGGVPDLENLQAIARLFNVSIDSLLGNEAESQALPSAAESASVTQCDAEEPCDFDIDFGHARNVVLTGIPSEKIRVTLSSNMIEDVESSFKVRLDTGGKSMDIEICRVNETTSATAREGLDVLIELPASWDNHVELAGNATSLKVGELHARRIELDGKFSQLEIDGTSSRVDVNTNEDLDITCTDLPTVLDVNQHSSTSKLYLPAETAFSLRKRGIGNRIVLDGAVETKGATSRIELNGMKSELTITQLQPSVKPAR